MSDNKFLDYAVCEALAEKTPYTADAIYAAYETLQSFDLVIATCDYSSRLGASLLEGVRAMYALTAKREIEIPAERLEVLKP